MSAHQREAGALVLAARAGARDAFDALYQRFSPLVHAVLLARLPPADADDLVQEVFLQAWQRLEELREPEAFLAWLCAIARRRAVDWGRRTLPTEPLPAHLAVAPSATTDLEAGAALAAIRQLPEAYREPLLLRLVEGMSGEEISRLTGLTPGSVRVNLHRGFRLLRQSLEGEP